MAMPASLTIVSALGFHDSRIRSVMIEEGSVSSRLLNELLLDFEQVHCIWYWELAVPLKDSRHIVLVRPQNMIGLSRARSRGTGSERAGTVAATHRKSITPWIFTKIPKHW
jgi:hypothetical protein